MRKLCLSFVAIASMTGIALNFDLIPFVPSNAVYADDTALSNAFKNQRTNIQVQGSGQVTKILADDLQGSRHQRFLLKLSSGQTLLIAHNIDLAPKINNLRVGDTVQFFGEYEWSEKGGIIHWTHKDPAKKHPSGWLLHKGRIYQ